MGSIDYVTEYYRDRRPYYEQIKWKEFERSDIIDWDRRRRDIERELIRKRETELEIERLKEEMLRAFKIDMSKLEEAKEVKTKEEEFIKDEEVLIEI